MARSRTPAYVCLPRQVVTHPPIRHRHMPAGNGYLTPFELDIACALLGAARLVLGDDLHQRALKGGATAIEEEVKTAKRYFKKREFSLSYGATPIRAKGGAIKDAGSLGYLQRKRALRRRPSPDLITVEVSRSRLLRWARLSPDGGSIKRLDATLQRLTESIGLDTPVLVGWGQLPSRKLRLRLSGRWIAQDRYARIPLPLPRTPNAKALYLFLCGIKNNSKNPLDISLDSLCRRLGMPVKWGPEVASRALYQALMTVNEHLATLDVAALEEAHLKVPGHYDIQSRNGRIRFVAHARPAPLDDEEPIPVETRFRQAQEKKLADIEQRKRELDRAERLHAQVQRSRP